DAAALFGPAVHRAAAACDRSSASGRIERRPGNLPVNIIGLNAYHGDVSAVLVRDGQLVAAVEEERFRRVKHIAGFPTQAIKECLRIGGLAAGDVDFFAVSRDPKAHLWRKALYLLRRRPRGTIADRARNAVRLGALGRTIAAELGLDESHAQSRTRFI